MSQQARTAPSTKAPSPVVMPSGAIVPPVPERTSLRVSEWSALSERVADVRNNIARRAFELFERGVTYGSDLDHWLRAEAELLHPVHVEISETDRELRVRAELPGFTSHDIELAVEHTRLAIAGQRHASQQRNTERRIYSEICANSVLRVIDLPAEVEPAGMAVNMKDGLLELYLPKAAGSSALEV